MKLPRRVFLHLAGGAAALPAVSCIGWAQAYPSRPVRLIVGFAPGGGNDIASKKIGTRRRNELIAEVAMNTGE
jgi:tripartite-type tricarboxylate transporter receptor subunit TctC